MLLHGGGARAVIATPLVQAILPSLNPTRRPALDAGLGFLSARAITGQASPAPCQARGDEIS